MMSLLVYRPNYAVESCDWILDTILRSRLGISFDCKDSVDNEFRIELAHDSCSLESSIYGVGLTLTLPNIFFSNAANAWLEISSLPLLPLASWDIVACDLDATIVSDTIPVLYGESGFFQDESGSAHLKLDVFGSAFFMLSRYEEAISTVRDSHDRFPAKASIAYKAGFLDRPIIDEYVEILWAAMQRVWPRLERLQCTYRTLLSHDVDWPSSNAFHSPMKVLRSSAANLLKRGDLIGAIRTPWQWLNSRDRLHPSDPYNTFDWLMDLSDKHGLKSSFYFICGCTDPTKDTDYNLEHPAIRRLLRNIHARGHEIGLHPSYNTFRNQSAIVAEADRLKRVCAEEGIIQAEWGARMHFLRWETPLTMQGLEMAGITYDTTLGYADRAGFRCGTCHEYRAFDPVSRQSVNLRIRPLIVMECTIIDERYMGLSVTPEAFEQFMKLKNACRTVSGDFTLLWHNSQFSTVQKRELYQAVLKE